jgi:Heparinase II/III-like protein/Alginate lyase
MPLIPDSEWSSLRQRATLPQFEAAMRKLRGDVDAFLRQPINVPAEPGGYYHDYFCPEHGRQLSFSPASPTEHRCVEDGTILRGARYDAAWRWFVNNRLSEAAQQLALLWRLEGKEQHLRRVSEILNDYARHYAAYQTFDREGRNPGIATYTTLDESVWILPLGWAFDMVRENLSSTESDAIAEKLLVPAAEHLVRRHYQAIHNFACWHNAAVGTLGLILDRTDLIDFAIRGEFGFEAQLRDGLLNDGLWFEGSFSYHFYTLSAFLALAKAARYRSGENLDRQTALRAMLRAPIECAYPDGSLPATNDCWYFTSLAGEVCHGVPPAASFYEVGYAWYGDPLFAHILNLNYQQHARDNLDALLYGTEALPPVQSSPRLSVNLPQSGYAILRPSNEAEGPGEGQYLFLKYGPHGGVHGHPDKLNLLLYACGQRLSPDLGTTGYGFDLCETWHRQTICHNTVTIDGCSQPPATGELKAFRSGGPIEMADARVAWNSESYEGVVMRRALLARSHYFLDVFWVECGKVRQIDWTYHNPGTHLTSLAASMRPLVQMGGSCRDGYDPISELQSSKTEADFVSTWRVADVTLNLYMAGSADSEIFIGRAPGAPPSRCWPMLVNRRKAAATAYLSVFHPHSQTSAVKSVRWIGRDLLQAGWAGCVVELTQHKELWVLRRFPDSPVPAWVAGEEAQERFEVCFKD